MLAAVKRNTAPNLLILNYNAQWVVSSLYLVPSLFFTESVLECRQPLGPNARRAGWIGCNILLGNVPDEAKLPMIHNTEIVSSKLVRERFAEYQQLGRIDWHLRGWTLDVLNLARKLGDQFTLQQVYEYESDLLRLHPANRNIRAKIRQQLQVLRNLGFLEFLGKGHYEFKKSFKKSLPASRKTIFWT